jgi:excisionase family DNA binding protein
MGKNKLSFTIAEAVTATGLGRSRLYEEIKNGRLRIVKAGRRTLVLYHDLEKWLASLPAGSPHADE